MGYKLAIVPGLLDQERRRHLRPDAGRVEGDPPPLRRRSRRSAVPEMFRRFGADEWDALRTRFRGRPTDARRRNRRTRLSDIRSRSAPQPSRFAGPSLPRERGEGRGEGRLARRVLYRDGLILVIDKPAGIAVHPGPGGGPDLESRFDELRFGLPHPPALAHRLDRDTVGLPGARAAIRRRCGGSGRCSPRGRSRRSIGPSSRAARRGGGTDRDRAEKTSPRHVGWRMVVDPAGQQAVTDYRVLRRR